MNKINPKIIFVGTPEFGAIILEELSKTKFKPCLVITSLDKPVGRKQILSPSPVKQIALKYNIPIKQPKKIEETKEEIKEIKPDLMIVAAYKQIIPKEILEIPKYKSFNIHPSLLPKYRGASPIQYTILNGEEKTGVTIYLMDEKIDHGPILSQKEFEIKDKKITYQKLSKELAKLGAELLLENIPKILSKKIKLTPQNEKEATYTKILKKEDGHIKWSKKAEEIERQIRAFEVWPQSYSFWNDKVLKILKSSVKILPVEIDYPYGKIVASPEKEILVATKENYFKIEIIQLEGKKKMTAKEFLNGYPKIIGEVLK